MSQVVTLSKILTLKGLKLMRKSRLIQLKGLNLMLKSRLSQQTPQYVLQVTS